MNESALMIFFYIHWNIYGLDNYFMDKFRWHKFIEPTNY